MLAETSILSNGAFLSSPNLVFACLIVALVTKYFAKLLLPNVTNSGIISTPYTTPVDPTIQANKAVVHPEPEPISSALSPDLGASFSNI